MNYTIEKKVAFDIISFQQNIKTEDLVTALKNIQLSNSLHYTSLILNMHTVHSFDQTVFDLVRKMHQDFYTNNCSLAIVASKELKNLDTDKELNIVPTLIEAIDIVSMEGLERELLSEDDF